jgi:hypothetical protein
MRTAIEYAALDPRSWRVFPSVTLVSLAHYDHDFVEWWSSRTCRLKDRPTGGEAGVGEALVVTEHAVFWQDRRDGVYPGHPWRTLSFTEIQEVLPVADDGVWEWIGVRKRSGSCLFFHAKMFADPGGRDAALHLRSLIVVYPSSNPAVPSETTRVR